MTREIFYTFNASAPPPDPTANSTKYPAGGIAYPVGGGYFKSIAKEGNDFSAVTSKSFERSPTDYVAYYPFNDNTLDASGNGYHLTNNGATLTNDRLGNANSAYLFNGSSNYMETAFINNISDITIYFEVFISNTISDYGVIIDKMIADGLAPGFRVQYRSSNILTLHDGLNSIDSGSITKEAWLRVCVRKSGSFLSWFINGTQSGIGGAVGSFSNTYNLRLGRYQGSGAYFNGILDEIKIFNRAVTEQEAILLTTE